MKYSDFVDLTYVPKADDVICDFHIDPIGDMIEVAGGVAAESSIGTWTELTTSTPSAEKLAAHVFRINGANIRVAYPIELFEQGNMPNILSSIAGNIFGLKALRGIRLNDVVFPEKLVRSFRGPKYGIDGIRDVLGVRDRPLIGTIIKPKLGLTSQKHAEVAYNAWVGGCDIVKDDENLSSQLFNPFKTRVVKTLEFRDKAEAETGEKKVYMINVTSETRKMIQRAQFIVDQGGEYLMVDVLTCGVSALQTLREQDFNLIIHAHRAGHAAITKNPTHGISMRTLAKLARIVGVDQLHVGTVVGKMSETKQEVLDNCQALLSKMHGLKRVLPVASGGLHPRLIPSLIDFFGTDFVIQAGGGIHGHPNGTLMGAKAMRQAVDATLHGISLNEYASNHEALHTALTIW